MKLLSFVTILTLLIAAQGSILAHAQALPRSLISTASVETCISALNTLGKPDSERLKSQLLEVLVSNQVACSTPAAEISTTAVSLSRSAITALIDEPFEFCKQLITLACPGLRRPPALGSLGLTISAARNEIQDLEKPGSWGNINFLPEDRAQAATLASRLTDLELAAIRRYTANEYEWLNSALRAYKANPQAESAQIAYSCVKELDLALRSALSKLPVHSGQIVRQTELPQAILAKHAVGNVVEYAAYTSTSYDMPLSARHKFVISSKRCARVDYFSAHPEEREVLCPAGMRFKVTNKRTSPDGKITFFLEDAEEARR